MEVTAEDLEFQPYYDHNHGRVLIKGVPANTKLSVKEFRESQFGAKLVEAGLAYVENLDLVLEEAQARFGKEQINMREFTAVAKSLWMLGDLKPKAQPVAQAPAPKQLSTSQLAWQEFRVFTDSHSVAECRARARQDERYQQFLHTNLVREMNQEIGGSVEAVGTQAVRQDKSVRITDPITSSGILGDAIRKHQQP